MATVKAPNRGYNGPGPAGVMFVDGEAETDNPAALSYFRRAGYEVSGSTKGREYPTAPTTEAPAGTWEPTLPAEVQVGTPLRDAAVDPIPAKDFLAPTNAGKADPHGPSVVAPGLHGVGPKPIRPGDVLVHDTDAQDEAETQLAQDVLVAGQPATIVAMTPPEGEASPAPKAVRAPSRPRASGTRRASGPKSAKPSKS